MARKLKPRTRQILATSKRLKTGLGIQEKLSPTQRKSVARQIKQARRIKSK